MKCVHCATPLIDHGDDRHHCNGCGCCFQADGRTPRPGHSTCAAAGEVQPAPERRTRREAAPPAGDARSTMVTEVPAEVVKGTTTSMDEGAAMAAEDSPSPERRTPRGT